MMLSQLQRELQSLRSTGDGADARFVTRLLERIWAWRHDSTTPDQLLADLGRILGESRFAHDGTHARVTRWLQAFRPNVESLGGMTMNERLVIFDLSDVWDQTPADRRQVLYAKLRASPGRPSSGT